MVSIVYFLILIYIDIWLVLPYALELQQIFFNDTSSLAYAIYPLLGFLILLFSLLLTSVIGKLALRSLKYKP
jgi:hypothetical protein